MLNNKKGVAGILDIVIGLIFILGVLTPISIDLTTGNTGRINSTSVGSTGVTIAGIIPLASLLMGLYLMFKAMSGGQ